MGMLGIVVLPLLATLAASASTDDATERARALYASGTEKFARREWRDARADFEAAYAASKKPGFLWNIAECARLAGDDADAIRFYRAYLHDAVSGSQRKDAEMRVRELEHKLELPPPIRSVPPPAPSTTSSVGVAAGGIPLNTDLLEERMFVSSLPPAPIPEDPAIWETWWFWTAAALLVGGAGASAYFMLRPGDGTGGITTFDLRGGAE